MQKKRVFVPLFSQNDWCFILLLKSKKSNSTHRQHTHTHLHTYTQTNNNNNHQIDKWISKKKLKLIKTWIKMCLMKISKWKWSEYTRKNECETRFYLNQYDLSPDFHLKCVHSMCFFYLNNSIFGRICFVIIIIINFSKYFMREFILHLIDNECIIVFIFFLLEIKLSF